MYYVLCTHGVFGSLSQLASTHLSSQASNHLILHCLRNQLVQAVDTVTLDTGQVVALVADTFEDKRGQKLAKSILSELLVTSRLGDVFTRLAPGRLSEQVI